MSFSFFKARQKTPQEVARATRDSLLALDTPAVVEAKALVKALEEFEMNFSTMKSMLCGDGESAPSEDQIRQLTVEICKEDVITLLVQKLLIFRWKARKDLVLCWSVLLKQNIENTCCVEYIENHLELLDFLVVWLMGACVTGTLEACLSICQYDNKDATMSCGSMLRDCIKFPTLAKYILESAGFHLFFKYVELHNFDVASDAFTTFKDLLTRHPKEVVAYLTSHYDEFFEMYENLLTSPNYVTRRQSLKLLSDFLLEPPNSGIMKRYILEIRYLKVIMMLLKDSSKNIQLSAFHIFKVFVANPNKPQDIKIILAKNCDKLLDLLSSLCVGKGSEDDQFEEEKEFIMKQIKRVSSLINSSR